MTKFKSYMWCLFLFFSSSLPAQQQEPEATAPITYFETIHPGILAWENYFEEKYFSQGFTASDLGEGSGYLPYLRERYFYDMRRDFRGDAGTTRRWEQFEQLRINELGRGGTTPAANWRTIGPNNMDGLAGRMISHAFDPFNSQIVYAGSATGGLWKTENGGGDWYPVTDQIPSTGVGAVAVKPNDSNTILIGTGEGYAPYGNGTGFMTIRPGLGVFKSTDGGTSWEQTAFTYQVANDVAVFKIIWNYADPNVVWMAATNGIWKSLDGGVNWILKKGDSSNQGTSICDDLVQHSDNPDILFASIEGDGVWKTTDGGEQWTKLTTGLPSSDINFISLALCKEQPEVLYALYTSGAASGFGLRGLYRTNDGGASWINIANTPNAMCSEPIPGFSYCQGWYNNVVAVSPVDPDKIWVGGITLWQSSDGGGSWLQKDRYACPNCVENPPCRTYVDQHDMGFDPANPEIVYVFNDGGVAKSTNGGACFELANDGLITAQFYGIASGRSKPDIVIGGFQDHGLQGVDLAQGNAWNRWGFLDGYDVEVHHQNENILYGTWIDGTYHRSTGGINSLALPINNGINQAENGGSFNAPLRAHPENADILLGCTRAKIYKSTNGGNSWVAVANAPNVTEVAFSQADPNHCYAAAWTGTGWQFYHSTNAGDNWNQTNSAPGWRITDLKTSFVNPAVVYATRNSINPNTAHVYRSTDFGNTWVGIQGDLPDIPVSGFAVNAYLPENLYVATDLGVFTSLDDGDTWIEYNQGLPICIVSDIEFNPTDTLLRIGTIGRGAWTSPAYCTEDISTNTDEARVAGFELQSIFPNPAQGRVKINYSLANRSNVKLDILDVTGQTLDVLVTNQQPAGEYSAFWAGSNSVDVLVPSGVYFVRLQVDQQLIVKQLVWHQE